MILGYDFTVYPNILVTFQSHECDLLFRFQTKCNAICFFFLFLSGTRSKMKSNKFSLQMKYVSILVQQHSIVEEHAEYSESFFFQIEKVILHIHGSFTESLIQFVCKSFTSTKKVHWQRTFFFSPINVIREFGQLLHSEFALEHTSLVQT